MCNFKCKDIVPQFQIKLMVLLKIENLDRVQIGFVYCLGPFLNVGQRGMREFFATVYTVCFRLSYSIVYSIMAIEYQNTKLLKSQQKKFMLSATE